MKLLSLSSKQFLTGIAPSAHSETGGLFFSADGVTPLYDAGGTASVENGLLQAGPSSVNLSGYIADSIICGASHIVSGTAYMWMMGNSGHFYYQTVGASDAIDRASANPISNPRNGMAIWGPAGGTLRLYYWRSNSIGTYDMTGNDHPASADSHWNDSVYTYTEYTSNIRPVHQFNGNVYYGNDCYLGGILDNGMGSADHNAADSASYLLHFPQRLKVSAISDDGTYLVIATTTNIAGNNTFAENKIIFWDLYSSQWTREWDIRDPFIYGLQKIGNVTYVFGQYGIYEVSFGGVRKIFSRFIGFGTMSDVGSGYGTSRACVYNGSALLFATDTTIDSFGRLSPDTPAAYFKHFKIPTLVGTPTFISSDLDVGRVYVATDGPKLYAYDFNATTRSTSVSAQTVYIPLGDKYRITRVDVVFGEPLATGDAMSIQLKVDEDTAASTAMVGSYAIHGGVRRVQLNPNGAYIADEQLSIVVNFTSGAVKIKRIEVYGDRVSTEQ